MELKRKSFLSLLLAGALFASISTETATLNFNLGDCVKWAQRSAGALFSSESFRKFAPVIVATGIVTLGMLWYRARKKKDILSEKPTKNSDFPPNFGDEEKNNEQAREAEIKERSAGQGTGLAECLSDSERLEHREPESAVHIEFC